MMIIIRIRIIIIRIFSDVPANTRLSAVLTFTPYHGYNLHRPSQVTYSAHVMSLVTSTDLFGSRVTRSYGLMRSSPPQKC
jgi:hypothetical protein